jgi:hypothetical protein
MTTEEHLERWLAGESVHNHEATYMCEAEDGTLTGPFPIEGGECCPDMSCCGSPLAPLEERQAFATAYRTQDEEAYMGFLTKWLGVTITHHAPEVTVYIAGAGATDHGTADTH